MFLSYKKDRKRLHNQVDKARPGKQYVDEKS